MDETIFTTVKPRPKKKIKVKKKPEKQKSETQTTELVKKNKTQTKININSITSIPENYPEDFTHFCNENDLTPPKFDTGNGKALALMLNYPNNYFTRKECNAVTLKFNITTNDSIQLFNKHSQWGLLCSEERGKYYIPKPYKITNKHLMRKDFKYDGTKKSKNEEIDNIKAHIGLNYIDIPNDKWQLGHKNPDSKDNTSSNLVLQPPIQAKYRDDYIFLDTFTKMPTPKKFKKLIQNKQCPYTKEQLIEFKVLLNSLEL